MKRASPERRIAPARPEVDGERKRGEEIADRIESDVIAAGWPVGKVIGSEAELLLRYDVSRAVLREAVRVLEHLGVARMRRGPGGGLIVTEPDPTAVLNAVVVYLTYERVRLDELVEVRAAIEEAACREAAKRCSAAQRERLLHLLEQEETSDRIDETLVHNAIASVTGNPALELFVEVLARLADIYNASTRISGGRSRAARDEAHRAHRRLVEAVVAGDSAAASRRVVRHLEGGRAFLTARQLERTLGFADAISPEGDDVRLAPVIARTIYVQIVANGWRVGELLGSEADLIARHGVSRAVLREAIRLLEFNRIVRTRRGPGGGVFVAAPTRAATVGAMSVYIESRGITPLDLFEVRKVIEIAAVNLALERLDAHGMAMLDQALAAERKTDDIKHVSHHLHELIAVLTGNPLFALFLEVLTRLAELHTPRSSVDIGMSRVSAAARVRTIHRRIVDAIVARDAVEASRLMERHLDALMPMHR